jgi:hypothetical protein
VNDLSVLSTSWETVCRAVSNAESIVAISDIRSNGLSPVRWTQSCGFGRFDPIMKCYSETSCCSAPTTFDWNWSFVAQRSSMRSITRSDFTRSNFH